MEKIKPSAILFDMDGVLVDSLDSWWNALNYSLKHFNHKAISKKEFIEKYWGHDLFYNLNKMKLPEEVGLFCNDVYYKYVDKIRLYPHVKDTLEKLNNYKKSIITNTPKKCTIQILKNFKLEKYFDIVLTSSDVSVAKPDPEIVVKSCKKLNVKPENTVLVGDTDSDIKAGKAAGCKVIGVKIKGDYIINDISELDKILII